MRPTALGNRSHTEENMAARRPSLAHVTIAAASALCLLAPGVSAQWMGITQAGLPKTPDGKVDLKAPVQRATDGKPDLSGFWMSEGAYFGNLARDLKNGEVQMLPWAAARVAENVRNQHKDDLMVQCMPPGVPRINMSGSRGMPHPMKIVQTPMLVVMLYETSSNQTFRQIFLDGRTMPKDPQPTWLGYSIGRWEGDTLVVQTTGFNGKAWLDTGQGHPQTEQGKVTEKFTRKTIGQILEKALANEAAFEAKLAAWLAERRQGR